MLQVEAKKRQAHGQTAPGRTLPEKSSEAFQTQRGDTRDIAAKQVGVSGYAVQGAANVKSDSVRKTYLVVVEMTVDLSGVPQPLCDVRKPSVFRR